MMVILNSLQTQKIAESAPCALPLPHTPIYSYIRINGYEGKDAHAPAHAHALYNVFAFMDSPM